MAADDSAESSKEQSAWLETPGRDTILIQGNCSIGRSAAGKSKLGSLMQYEPAGAHELKGFEGKLEFFKC